MPMTAVSSWLVDMTYQEIVDKIEKMRRFGRATGYQVSREMLDRL